MITTVDRQLMRIEVTRSLRQPLLWIGAVLSILMMTLAGFAVPDRWPGEMYTRVVDGTCMPLAAAALMIGALAAIRDAHAPLAPAAAVDVERRTATRLAVLAAPVAVAAGLALATAIAARVRGGFTVGEGSWSTDSLQPPIAALLQGPLLVAALGALGALVGRATRSVVVSALVTTIVLAVFLLGSWAWVWLPVTPLRQTLFEIDLPSFDAATVDRDWLLAGPGEFDTFWRRQLIHTPAVAGHNVYLAGVMLLCGGLTVGSRPAARRVALAGGAVALLGVAVQIATYPG